MGLRETEKLRFCSGDATKIDAGHDLRDKPSRFQILGSAPAFMGEIQTPLRCMVSRAVFQNFSFLPPLCFYAQMKIWLCTGEKLEN